MTARIPLDKSTWLFDWNILTLTGNTMPPRDPNDDDDDDDAEDDDTESNFCNSRSVPDFYFRLLQQEAEGTAAIQRALVGRRDGGLFSLRHPE